MCFYGGHSTGHKLGNHHKNIEPCTHRARTVRQRPLVPWWPIMLAPALAMALSGLFFLSLILFPVLAHWMLAMALSGPFSWA